MTLHRFAAPLALAFCLPLAGCELFSGGVDDLTEINVDAGIPGFGLPTIGGAPYGDSCDSALDCRFGLVCVDDACGVSPQPQAGEECVGTAECADDLICAPNIPALTNPGLNQPLAICAERGEAGENETCATDVDCIEGFRCTYFGFNGICTPDGTADFGQPCQETSDCQAPLACVERPDLGVSEPACFYPVDLFLPDVSCTSSDDSRPIEFLFEVPDGEVTEFYRLPFPNDIRLTNGTPDLSGHHNPGADYLGGDVVDAYVSFVQEASDGFSTNPTVFFRASRQIDASSVTGGGDAPTLFFRNIDPDSENYGQALAMSWYVDPNPGKFICQNYIAVHGAWTTPLEHDTTYAVWLTTGVTDTEGNLPEQGRDFAAVIGNERPGDDRLGRAWDAYAPLRDYLQAEDIGTGSVLTAAVFTTGDPDADLEALREGVRAQAAPRFENLTVCDTGVESPCDDGSGERSCSAANPDYIEVHGTYSAPIWQRGTRPYLLPTDGGDLEYSQGEAVPQGIEEICVSMVIPRDAEMPEAGWPVVLSAHGTGGSFLSHITNESGPDVTAINLGDDTVRMVSISIDGAQHANRRGDSDLSPETLFYNFANPLAARGNVLQGGADYMMLSYMLESAELEVDGETVRFDPDQRYFFGHSQGATVGSLILPVERTLRGAVLSGAGGSLTLSLLNKTSPEDIAGAVDFALTDGTGEATQFDPLLALLQWWIDPVDPLNVARQYWRSVPEESVGTHIFMSYGYGDTYTPEPNMQAFAGAAGLSLGTPAEGSLSGLRESAYPVSGNVAANGEPITAIIVPGSPSGYDGHFVVFRNDAVQRRSLEFLGTGVRDGVPTVSQ